MNLTTSLDLAIDALQQRIWYVEGFHAARGVNAAETKARRVRRIAEYKEAQASLAMLRKMIAGEVQ